MNKSKFIIRLSDNNFCCLGNQLVKILNILHPYVKNCSWYVAEIITNDNPPYKLGLQNANPQLIGNFDNLQKIVSGVDQFQSGQFVAFPPEGCVVADKLFYPEDGVFSKIGFPILEISAFDTSYYEIYTNDVNLVRSIFNHFAHNIVDFLTR